MSENAARREGAAYRRTYFADVQFVFSRRQHHWHKRVKSKDGKKTNEWKALTACKPKAKGKGLCRARFPKTKQINAKVKSFARESPQSTTCECLGVATLLGVC